MYRFGNVVYRRSLVLTDGFLRIYKNAYGYNHTMPVTFTLLTPNLSNERFTRTYSANKHSREPSFRIREANF